MANNTSYFKDTEAFIVGNKSLRALQRIAHRKLEEEIKKKPNTHKIITLPTGTGKTGVIALAPYGISEGKVLVITPSLIIKQGISDEFDTRTPFNFWTKTNVIVDEEKLPTVYRYAGYNSNSEADKKRVIRYLNNANIIIANIHKISNVNSNKTLIDILDPDFFDMIIIDEAHHSAADSWKNTLEYFNAKKIVKLTATPYRTDSKELDGEIIYSYSLSDAIRKGLIKNLVSEDYTNENLEFVVDGELVSKEEAIDAMDKNWVTRSVAYSEHCSRTIVEMSIKRLIEKRRLGNAHHQILAVACSIKHAEQIKKLYGEYNLRAEYVSSDRIEESEKIIIEYKKGQIDVLVNVNMLGEGFDHPNISIAAIFRPFRTLAPYAQFIGRALRRIQNDDPIDSIDNVAHVIYHKELDLDDLWDYYSKEKVKAEKRKMIELEYGNDNIISRDRDIGDVETSGKVISTVKTFLEDKVDFEYRNAIQAGIDEIENDIKDTAKKMKEAGISKENIDEFIKAKRKKMDEYITSKRDKLRAELIREELHEIHTEDIISQIDNLFEITKTDPRGTDLPDNTSSPILKITKTNDGYAKKYINSCLKRELKRGIDEWETYDFEQARLLIPYLIEKIKEKIERIGGKNGREDKGRS
ncbi:MAG TPA: hypothetical protein DHV55_00745 [Clostridiaceae bacterium]|nr:hypothetical protein [Clostridiaceae bacterium]